MDDADLLDPQGRQALAGLVGKVRGIVLAATTRPALLHHLPLAKEAQASGMGLVLAPPGTPPHDGELLGVRLESDRGGRPGRGFLISGAEVKPFKAYSPQAFHRKPKGTERVPGSLHAAVCLEQPDAKAPRKLPPSTRGKSHDVLLKKENNRSERRNQHRRSLQHQSPGYGGETNGENKQLGHQSCGTRPPIAAEQEVAYGE